MPAQTAKTLKNQDKICFHANLNGYIQKAEKGGYVSYCWALDLYSQGDTVKEAKHNILEATELFIEGCIEDGTLDSVLRDCGFRRADEKPARKRRKISAAFGRAFKIPAEVPLYAAV